MLTMADKGGIWTPPFVADIICEQPLIFKEKQLVPINKINFFMMAKSNIFDSFK